MMMKLFTLALGAAALVMVRDCEAPAPEVHADAAAPAAPRDLEDAGYFAVLRGESCDGAACRLQVARVNRINTVCGDGSLRPACPVGELELAGLGLDAAAEAALRGALADGRALVRGDLVATAGGPDRMIVREGWVGRGGAPSGKLYRLRDSGVRCTVAPCPAARAWRLSTSWSALVAGVELAGSGATAAEQAAGQAALATADGLIAAGPLTKVKGPGGKLDRVAATAFYVRVRAGAAACDHAGPAAAVCA